VIIEDAEMYILTLEPQHEAFLFFTWFWQIALHVLLFNISLLISLPFVPAADVCIINHCYCYSPTKIFLITTVVFPSHLISLSAFLAPLTAPSQLLANHPFASFLEFLFCSVELPFCTPFSVCFN
jgi:hypothetical protein